MTTVILAEKPSQARSYVQAFQKSKKKQGYYTVSDPVLPENTLVTYGLGHLVELATPDKYNQKYQQWALSNLPIFPNKYKFIVPTDKKKQFKVVKDLLTKADTIIVATDSDREGENIAWSIMNQAKINLKSKEILYKEELISFTKREYEIIELLALNRNQVFSKEKIYEKIWGLEAEGDSQTIAEHVKKIRAKFLKVDQHFNYLKTVWGIGYKWSEDQEGKF